MLPGNTRSSIAVSDLFLNPDDLTKPNLVDYELGGVALNNASQGLMVKVWRCYAVGVSVMLQPQGGTPIELFATDNITELALTFDQNMQWSVAYVQLGILKLRWYDSSIGNYRVSVFNNARNPRMTLDDKRRSQSGVSDMILAYIENNTLYYRQQRDRFTVARVLRENLFNSTILKSVGMSRNYRVQFELA